VEDPLVKMLAVGVDFSAGWVDVDAAEVRRRTAANFILLETRFDGEMLESLFGLLPIIQVGSKVVKNLES
jgi:hypothetical protein